jgi:hypothetical protein
MSFPRKLESRFLADESKKKKKKKMDAGQRRHDGLIPDHSCSECD